MTTPARQNFGRLVRELRLARGWTQEKLAEKAGLHPTYVGSIERGKRNVSLDNIMKIASGLSVHPAELFNFRAV